MMAIAMLVMYKCHGGNTSAKVDSRGKTDCQSCVRLSSYSQLQVISQYLDFNSKSVTKDPVVRRAETIVF